MIRSIRMSDISACVTIYNSYITNTTSTFELTPLTREQFLERVSRITETYPYLVYEDDETESILGYAYLDQYSERQAYRFTCDLSIYLAPDVRGRGIGHQLYQSVENAALEMGIYTIFAIVTTANDDSSRFHERQGFTLAAQFDNVAFKHGQWLGVRYYRKNLRIPDGEPQELLVLDI